MKNILLILSLSIITLFSFGQNNPPVAVNDTFYVTFNETVSIVQSSGITSAGNPVGFLNNDSDPDGNRFFIDSTIYNGAGTYSDSLDEVIANTLHRNYIDYSPSLNFWGIDSIIYIIFDNGIPVMYDTATIYLFVKRPEYETIDLNNINASFGLNLLFSNPNSLPGFEVPKGSSSHSIYGGNLWVSGSNQGSIYLDASTFGNYTTPNSLSTFSSRSGPIMNASSYKNYDFKWDRLWKITSAEIDYHISNWNSGGYQPIEVIANWPAHGDVSKGQALDLAPFVDNNNDNLYNPLDGDYPLIKGQQAIYSIYNDHINGLQTNGSPMVKETHYMAYVYNCPSDSAIDNTLFLDYTIYNRSNLTYDSTYVGMWTDFDIGNFDDDFVGCDVNRSAYYGYNGDGNDDSANGSIGYGIHPPAQGVVFLKGVKQDDDGMDNAVGVNPNETVNGLGFGDGIDDNENWGMEHFVYYNAGGGVQGDPNNDLDYHNYLSGKWRDNSQMVFGGTGHYSSGGTISAKYLFPGDSDPLLYGTHGVTTNPSTWSEITENNSAADRRGVGSTGPFTFEPDSSISITLAYVFGRDYQTTGNQVGVVVMQERIDSIRSYYLNDFSSVCGGSLATSLKTEVRKEDDILISPNPFNAQFTINYKVQNNTALLEIYNIIGEKIQTKTITNNLTLVDLRTQTNGFYFVTITDGANRVSKKVVKH